jgi:hypothetical protein
MTNQPAHQVMQEAVDYGTILPINIQPTVTVM